MTALTPSSAGCAITIGTFDGVHLGHAALIDAARRAAGSGGRVMALVFDPHPLTVLRPDDAPERLTTFAHREALLRASGANDVIQLTPTPELLNRSPQDFLDSLVTQYAPTAVVEGPDFRFGRARAGDIDTLRTHGRTNGYTTVVIDPVDATLTDCTIVRAGSSRIRWLLHHGRVADAAILLGREYELFSTVVRGDQRGRDLGFPTANLSTPETMLPADGIYAGMAHRDDRAYPAAISIGTKPTFGEHARTCEAHLLDYDGPAPETDDYDWNIRLRFTHWLRDQLTYDDIHALIDQLHRDIEHTRMVLAGHVDSGLLTA